MKAARRISRPDVFPRPLHAGHLALSGGWLGFPRSGSVTAVSPCLLTGYCSPPCPRRSESLPERPLAYRSSRSGPTARRRLGPSAHKLRDSGREVTMQPFGNDVLGTFQRGLLTAGLLAVMPSLASAQMVFDGNLMWQNTIPCNTVACQFVGSAGVGAPACAAGTTALTLGTVTYTHNVVADPLLPLPDFQPS